MTKKLDINRCCICCGNKYRVLLSDCKTPTGKIFTLVQCETCSLVSLHPIPSNSILEQNYYDKTYWQRKDSRSNSMLGTLYKLRISRTLKNIVRLVKKNGRLLDWGCGDGALLRVLRPFGFECFGIDPYCAVPDDKNVIAATIEASTFPNAYFDAITCFHVLEHISNPVESVKKALDLLKIGGILIVEVPNIASVGFQVFKRRWQPLEVPTHLNFFTPKTLQELFIRIGKTSVIKVETFSHRVSPSAVVLSLFPSLSPKRVRKASNNQYPFPLMVIYLVMQILAYPFAMMESCFGRGAVVRLFVRKTQE